MSENERANGTYQVEERLHKSYNFAIAGATSGFITRALCQPWDVVKIRFQVS